MRGLLHGRNLREWSVYRDCTPLFLHGLDIDERIGVSHEVEWREGLLAALRGGLLRVLLGIRTVIHMRVEEESAEEPDAN